MKALHSVGLTASTGLAVAVVAPEGIVELIAAVTGAQDDVADILVSGTFRRTIAERRLKVCSNHRWDQPIGSVLSIKELLPGDLALPRPVRFERVHWDRQVLQRPIQTRGLAGKARCVSAGQQLRAGSSTDASGAAHCSAPSVHDLAH